MRSTSNSRSNKSERPQAGIAGFYHDGKSSRRHKVTVNIAADNCSVKARGIKLIFPLSDLKISEPFKNSNRIIKFPDGSLVEIPDSAAVSAALVGTTLKDPLVVHIQSKWKWVALSFFILIVAFFTAYRWGLPVAAEKISHMIPEEALQIISKQALAAADEQLFAPSTLSERRQKNLRNRFKRLSFHNKINMTPRIEFRRCDLLGPNALTLPDGTIIFLDSIVKIANDNELTAVYAHESGHAFYRHGMRNLIQNSVISMTIAVYVGDVSAVIGGITGWLLESKYSRDFERDADLFAAAALKHNKLSPGLLGKMLLKLEKEHERIISEFGEKKLLDYISTHPATEERIKILDSYK